MPELPEVETIKLGLQKYLVGHTIESVEVKLPRIFQGDKENITGAKVIAVRRFGKGLVIDLSNKYSLAIHIKLTGQLVYKDASTVAKAMVDKKITKVRVEVPNKFTHVIFHLDKGATLYYNDLRQFGWIKVVPTEKVKELSFFKELGPEFMSDLDKKKFEEILSKSRLSVKPLIMDQKKMAGIGNIYANDALYLAKIDPKRPANNLSLGEIKTLYNAIITVLKKGIKEGGSSELTFVNALGEEGNYQNHTLIYGRDGQKCKRDGTTIKKIMIGGRGTYFCPSCQE